MRSLKKDRRRLKGISARRIEQTLIGQKGERAVTDGGDLTQCTGQMKRGFVQHTGVGHDKGQVHMLFRFFPGRVI